MAARDRQIEPPMSDKELIDEVMTLIVAGHETTAAALTWTWYLISAHPETAAELEAEADRTADGVLGLDAAESLAFTHQVIQEALRLYPPGWLFTRRTLEADELGDTRWPRAPTCSSAPIRCIATRSSGRRPRSFSRSASPASTQGAPSLRLHPLLGRPAALHRREHGDVRDAGPREPGCRGAFA